MAKKKKVPEKLYRVVSINRVAGLVSYMSRDSETVEEAGKRLASLNVFPGQELKLEEATNPDPPRIRKLGESDTFLDPKL